MIDESGYDICLEIDGGVKVDNIKEIAEAGVDMFVAGSAIFNSTPAPLYPPEHRAATMPPRIACALGHAPVRLLAYELTS